MVLTSSGLPSPPRQENLGAGDQDDQDGVADTFENSASNDSNQKQDNGNKKRIILLPLGTLDIADSVKSSSIPDEIHLEYVKPDLVLENMGDPLAENDNFDKNSLFGHDSIYEGAEKGERL